MPKADMSEKTIAESILKTRNLQHEVLAFLLALDERKMVTGWGGVPVNEVADYITGYIIGTMRGR